MSQRPPCPAGFPWVSPYLSVKDADAAIDFYQRAFGFEKRMAMPGPNGKTAHAEMTWKDGVIMLGPEGPNHPCKAPVTLGIQSPISLYVYCEDVDAQFARATAAGAKGVLAPENKFYGDRVCSVTDPDGYTWYFATNVADFDPANMPH
jgi:PhnB protein